MFRALSWLLKLVPLFGLFAAQSAMAAVAVASLDWSRLEVSVFAIPGQPPPTLTYAQQQTDSSANTSTSGDSTDSHTHTSFNWTASSSIASDTPGAHGGVLASAGTLSASAFSSSVLGTPLGFPSIIANSSGGRTASFQLDAPAAVAFSVPYSLSVTGTPFDFIDASDAQVSGNATFQTFDGSTNGSQRFDLNSIFSGPGAQSGFLIFGIVASGPGSGNVSFGASASSSADFSLSSAVVPEPGTIVQLLAGLLGVTGIAWRRGMGR